MAFRIEELAAGIPGRVTLLANHLREKNLAEPSFSADGPNDFPVHSREAEQARIEAITQCYELLDLLQGPQMCVRPCYNATSLHAIYKFGVAQKVPMNEEISFVDLAKKCDMYEPDLRRIIRFAITYHRVFNEPRPGYVSHSAASRELAQQEDVQHGIGLMFDDFYQSFAHTVEAMQTYKSQEPGQTGWSIAHDCVDQNLFEYLGQHPDKATRFGGAMKFFSRTAVGNEPSYLVDNYDWESLGNATVVDIGGSSGYVSFALAKQIPNLHCIVEDLPEVVEAAVVPEDLTPRVEFRAQNFFEPQGVHGADVYLFRWVLHDWPDAYVIKILQQLAPALKKGSRIIINDYVAPGQAGQLPYYQERFVRELDMIMLSAFNSYEREIDDWKRVVRDAHEHFGEVNLIKTGGLHDILEIKWEGS